MMTADMHKGLFNSYFEGMVIGGADIEETVEECKAHGVNIVYAQFFSRVRDIIIMPSLDEVLIFVEGLHEPIVKTFD